MKLAAALVLLLLAAAVAAEPGDAPEGWRLFKVNDKKKLTAYELVLDGGKSILHAKAEASASGVYKVPDFSLADRPVLAWRWKVSRLIPGADNSQGAREDSPARIVLAFEGDRDKLPRSDRRVLRIARTLSGKDLPYATLMYVWSNKAPVGTVIPNPHTGRIQMIVASSGAAGVGAWQDLSRNVVEDYRRAFREEPGRLLGYGVMSDTDNTGESVEAWYGEIDFRAR